MALSVGGISAAATNTKKHYDDALPVKLVMS